MSGPVLSHHAISTLLTLVEDTHLKMYCNAVNVANQLNLSKGLTTIQRT